MHGSLSLFRKSELAVAALKLVPKNAISRAAGKVAGISLPRFLQQAEIRAFGAAVGVDFDEVREPLHSFGSLQDFFVRELKSGARPIDGSADALVAPCDGAWGAAGLVEAGMLLQVKGRPYRLGALLGDEKLAAEFEGGVFATCYLSPRDYHRFHAPCDARVLEARYLPGSLWPVNRIGLEGVDGLFAENERISTVMQITPRVDAPRLCIVAVGATMVGRVHVCFDSLTTNESGAQPAHRIYAQPGYALAKGQEWGRFEFGSTLVMIAEAGALALDVQVPGTPLRLGQRIGTLVA